MKIKNQLSISLARCIGRSILKTDIHPIIHITLLLVSLIHTLLCFTPVTAKIYSVFKWFNIGLYIEPLIFTTVLLVPNVLVALSFITQIIWAFTESEIETTVIKHYIIKGSTTLGYVLSLTLTLPLIQSSVSLISSAVAVWKIIGIINLLFFLLIVYPYTMFLLTDISPQNNKLFAYVDFPNCFTIYNIYRPIGAFIVATSNHQFSLIPTVMLFCIELFFIIKSPIITWKYNRFSKGFISCLLWLVICRFFNEDDLNTTTIVAFYLIGTPFFVICSYYLLKKRITFILKNRKNSVLKLKTLYLILYNKASYGEEIDQFLMNHYRECPYDKCCCHKIISQVQNEKIANENHEKAVNNANKGTKRASAKLKERFSLRRALGFSKSKNENEEKKENGHQTEEEQVRNSYMKLKENENVFWFQLLYEMQTEDFFIDQLKELPTIQRDIEFKKAKLIILDQAEVLHYYLEKQYQSLRNLWFFDQLSETNYVSLFSKVRFCIEEQKQQETIKLKSSQEGSNQYALNYFDFQTKLLFFRSLLLKAVIKCEGFWKELYSKQPDQNKITTSIKEIYSSHKKVIKEIKKYTIQHKGKSKNNNEYEQNWELKIKKIIQNVYSPFQFAMQLTEIDKESEELLLTDSEKEHKVFEKNLIFYDSNAKTGMGVVNVQEGEEFGSITATNKEFWEILNCPRYEKVKINHFLVKEMHEYHNKVMINFLNHNKHFLNFHGGYACDGNKLLVRIEFSVELLPHIYDGLQAAVFLQVFETPKGLFLTDQNSNILSYNQKFQEEFLELRSVQDFDEIISKQVIEKLEENKKHVINLDGEDYLIEFCHTIQTNGAESQKIYFCEIAQVWEDIPTNIPMIEDEAKESICQKSTEDKNEKSLGATIKKKGKEKKESLESLLLGLKSEDKSSKVLKWKIFITIFFGLLFILAILSAVLSEVKTNIYRRTDRRTEYITELFQNIVEGPYLCRKLNIMLFNNKTQNIDQVIKSVQSVEQKITELKNILGLGLWAESSLEGIEITEYNKYVVDNTTFEMVLQKYLLSAYTTMLINLEQVNYDYIQDNVPIPYPLQWTNFYSIIFNTHYSVLWNIEMKYKTYIDTEDYVNLLTLHVSPIFYLSLILILFSVVMQLITFLFKIRIIHTLWLSLKLLEKIGMVKVEERVENLRVYREKFLEDLIENKNRIVIEGGQKTKMITMNKENNAIVADDMPSISMDMMETTSREFQQTNREKEALAEQSRKTNKLRIKEFSKSKVFLKEAAGVMPIILLSISLIAIQLSFDRLMWNTIYLKYYYQLKIEGIQKLKAMSFEFGYEDDDLKTEDFSITNNMLAALEVTYLMHRDLKDLQNRVTPGLGNLYSELGSTNFCNVFEKVGYNLCTSEEEIMFLDKSWNEAMIDYIETSRYVHQQYSGLGNSQEKIREYSNSEYHNKFLVYSIRLKQMENYMLTMLNDEINYKIDIYEVVVIVVSVAIMIYLMIGKFYWSSKTISKMNSEVNEIKTTLQLISYKEIGNNNVITEELNKNMYYYDVIV